MSTEKGVIHQGQNSGYQAINLAVLLGFRTIALLGFDMQGKGTHFFGKHPPELSQSTNYANLCEQFEKMRPERYGVEVINCTRQTALTCFPRMSLEDFIASHFGGDRAEPDTGCYRTGTG